MDFSRNSSQVDGQTARKIARLNAPGRQTLPTSVAPVAASSVTSPASTPDPAAAVATADANGVSRRDARIAARNETIGGVAGQFGDKVSQALDSWSQRKAARDAAKGGLDQSGQGGTTDPAAGTGTAATGGQTGIDARVSEIISSNSPLMQQARTLGLDQANRRGLANSTMAIGAMGNEMLKAAVPIASQESQQQQALTIADKEIAANKSLKQLDIATQKELQTQKIAADENLARINEAGAERNQLASAITNLSAQRYTAYAQTLANPDIPADVRAAVQQSINDQHTAAMDQLQNLYGVSVNPASIAAATASTPTPASTTPATSTSTYAQRVGA